MRRTQSNLSLVATPASAPLAERVARELGISLFQLRSERFANENLEVRAVGLATADRDVVLCQTFSSGVSDRLLELLLGLRALRSTAPRRLTALLPYFPYARSDRPESERAGADRVVSVDLHAPQIAGFFRVPLVELSARSVLLAGVRAWQLADPVVVSPDLGGAKRAAAFAAALGAPLALISKKRSAARVTSLDLMGDVAGRSALLVDDEIATGAKLEIACVSPILASALRGASPPGSGAE
jgi:ribose-phosphate pyrophosphokinase